MTFPRYGKIKTCSKPPTSNTWVLQKHPFEKRLFHCKAPTSHPFNLRNFPKAGSRLISTPRTWQQKTTSYGVWPIMAGKSSEVSRFFFRENLSEIGKLPGFQHGWPDTRRALLASLASLQDVR